MSRIITKKGALEVTGTLDRLATLFQREFAALGVPQRVAQDFMSRCDKLADHIERQAGLKVGTDFPADDIGEEKAGPLEDEPDEPYMKGEFSQQENRELRERVEKGELGPDRITTEPQTPTQGVQAGMSGLIHSLMNTRLADNPRVARATRLYSSVLKSAMEEEEEVEVEEKESGKKKASHGFDLFG